MDNITIKKVLGYTKKYNPLILLSLVLSAVSVISSLFIPLLAGRAIDSIHGINNVDFNSLKKALSGILVFALIYALSQWIAGVINNKISCFVVRDIRNTAVEKISILPLSYLDSNPVGEILSRVINDADILSQGLLMGFTQFFTGILTIVGTVVIMFTVSFKVAPVVIFLTPLSLFVANFVAKRTHSMFLLQSEKRGVQTAYIEETVTGRSIIAAYGATESSEEKFKEINEELSKVSLRAIFFSSLTNPSTRFVNNTIYAFVALVGGLCVLGGSLTVGGLTALLNFSAQYAKPFNEISSVIAELQNALACAKRLFDLIEQESETTDKENAVDRKELGDRITLENVEFSYSPDKKLVENLNLSVNKGEKIAIVGPTGCGKTTVINLLMRFYDVQGGNIKIDEVDIRDITRKSLRAGYGMVLQDTWIKSATVAENIAVTKPTASRKEIIQAAKSAYAHSFIKRLPKGYDTVISNDSTIISQGQKQLICIARIMLSIPPTLILDEATSSIDTRTEINIRKAFEKLMQGRTSFIVAHRLSTIRNSDTILVMKDGKVIEQGNHQELMAQNGFYMKLYNSSRT